MHAVVELPGFVAAAKEAGLSDDVRTRIIDRVAERPDAGGARKARFAGRGKGKSGGYRVVTFDKGVGLAGVPDHAVLEG